MCLISQGYAKIRTMKKVLVINGSPRRKGLISRMLDIMIEEAEFNGCEVVLGKYPRSTEVAFRPYGLWYDARHGILSGTVDEG